MVWERCRVGNMGYIGAARWPIRRHPAVSLFLRQFVAFYLTHLRYFYSGPTFAVTEADGVRLVGPDSCEFIQKVPGE